MRIDILALYILLNEWGKCVLLFMEVSKLAVFVGERNCHSQFMLTV